MFYFILRSIAIAITLFIANPSLAVNSAVTVKDWLFLKIDNDGNNQCYAYSMPYRTSIYHWGEERSPFIQLAWHGNNQYTISVSAGFELAKDTPLIIETLENGSYQLLTAYSDSALTYSSIQDSFIINNLIESDEYFKVKSINKSGAKAIDYYSLRGFIATLKLMQNNCTNNDLPNLNS